MKETKSSVLACVTSQYDCDRIIKTAKEIADDCGYELRVLSILNTWKIMLVEMGSVTFDILRTMVFRV